MTTQLQRSEPQGSRPTTGSFVQRRPVCGSQADSLSFQQQRRLFEGEPQLLRSELAELFLQSHPRHGQAGVAPCGQHEA